MNDPRWDEPRTELLGDVDSVTFAPPGRSGGPHRGRGWLAAVAAFALGVGVGAGVLYDVRSGSRPQATQRTPNTVVFPEPFRPAPDPAQVQVQIPQRVDPRSSYRTRCAAEADAPLAGSQGPGLVSSVLFDNRGNVGISYTMKTVWYVAGGHNVTRTIGRDVPPGATVRASVTVPVTSAEVAANRSFGTAGGCTTEVSLVSTFGDTYR